MKWFPLRMPHSSYYSFLPPARESSIKSRFRADLKSNRYHSQKESRSLRIKFQTSTRCDPLAYTKRRDSPSTRCNVIFCKFFTLIREKILLSCNVIFSNFLLNHKDGFFESLNRIAVIWRDSLSSYFNNILDLGIKIIHRKNLSIEYKIISRRKSQDRKFRLLV